MTKRTTALLLCLLALAAPAAAHRGAADPVEAAAAFLESLPADQRQAASLPFDAPQRTAFRWTPGRRAGLPLAALSPAAREELRHLLTMVLSEAGALTLDAILATEAALGLIEGRPDYRDPERYYAALFGTPGPGRWGLRFEGHHLSINLTFEGAQALSGTPLFLGANPETVTRGPDRGLRALPDQVDLAWQLYASLSAAQRRQARDTGGGYGGFLTRPGSLGTSEGPAEGPRPGIAWADMTAAQRELAIALARSYLEVLAGPVAAPYLQRLLGEEAAGLRFHWAGAEAPGGSYYYRLAGRRLFIEHDAFGGGSHVHAVWRDAGSDFGRGAGER